MKKIDLVQRSEEWKKFRSSRIMASDVPVIIGVSPYKTPYRLFMQKIGLEEEDPITAPMQKGIDNEDAALELFNQMTGLNAKPCVVVHPDLDWLGASLDGLSEDGQMLVEIKCPGAANHNLAVHGHIPVVYYPQIQMQLFVAGLVHGKYFSYDVDAKKGVIVDVTYDAQYVAGIFPKLTKFQEDRANLIPPEMGPGDYIQMGGEAWQEQSELYREMDKQIKVLTTAKEEARKKLIELAGGKSAQGCGIKVQKTLMTGRIKYDEIPELDGVDLEQHRSEPTVQWRLYSSK